MNEAHSFGDVFTIQVCPEEKFDGELFQMFNKSVPVIQEESKDLYRKINMNHSNNLSARSNLS